MNYSFLINERSALIKTSDRLKAKIDKLPEGTVICTKNRRWSKWYKKIDSKWTYIPSKKLPSERNLILRNYLECQLEDIQSEIDALTLFLESIEQDCNHTSTFLSKCPKLYQILKLNQPESETFTLEERSSSNPNHPESLIHSTMCGIFVRSKSEAMIADALYSMNIPFRYEAPLTIGEFTIYPDFTILNPNSKKVTYWEHLGMMDDSDYREKAIHKLQTYSANDILPGINLILTSETREKPLQRSTVESIVYFIGEQNSLIA